LTPGSSQYTVTKWTKGQEPDVSQDPLGKTDHLYLRYINPGSFTMGSPANEFDRITDRETQTHVTLTSGFYISVYAITDHQYKRVMSGSDTGVKTPMHTISWNTLRGKSGADENPANVNGAPAGAGSFLWKLMNEVYVKSGNTLTMNFDLPTEAQWEYACRAGTSGTFSYLPSEIIENPAPAKTATQMNTQLLPDLGQYSRFGNSTSTGNATSLQEVGTRLPNPAGLYDMHGNIYEWCRDAFSSTSGQTDLPGGSISGPFGRLRDTGSFRVFRGGGWNTAAVALRSAFRNVNTPGSTASYFGFRLSATGAAVP